MRASLVLLLSMLVALAAGEATVVSVRLLLLLEYTKVCIPPRRPARPSRRLPHLMHAAHIVFVAALSGYFEQRSRSSASPVPHSAMGTVPPPSLAA